MLCALILLLNIKPGKLETQLTSGDIHDFCVLFSFYILLHNQGNNKLFLSKWKISIFKFEYWNEKQNVCFCPFCPFFCCVILCFVFTISSPDSSTSSEWLFRSNISIYLHFCGINKPSRWVWCHARLIRWVHCAMRFDSVQTNRSR